MKTSEEKLSLENIRGGAATEVFNRELQAVMDDIVDPNKVTDAVREVTLKLKIKPDEKGSIGAVQVSVGSKLAPRNPVNTAVVIGGRHGKGEARELVTSQHDLFNRGENVIPMLEREENHD